MNTLGVIIPGTLIITLAAIVLILIYKAEVKILDSMTGEEIHEYLFGDDYKVRKKFSKAVCRLDCGTIAGYDAAANIGERPYNDKFEYMGDGVVYAIQGKRQPGNTRMSFFKLIDDNKNHHHFKNYTIEVPA